MMGCPIPVMNKPHDEDKCIWVKEKGHWVGECGHKSWNQVVYDGEIEKCPCGKPIKILEE